jgi:2-hydroxychromene-2-carboxylate isomerase
MTREVEFYFDVGSPYTYLAYHQLPKIALARQARVVWRPMLLGGVFQATGNRSPVEVPSKGRYAEVDLLRWARYFGVPLRMNPHFPINTLLLMRAAVALQASSDDDFHRYLATVFRALFEVPRDLSSPSELAAVLTEGGFDPQRLLTMAGQVEVKEALKKNTADAVGRGVFGAPTFFVGDAMYWGQDRLTFVEQALA